MQTRYFLFSLVTLVKLAVLAVSEYFLLSFDDFEPFWSAIQKYTIYRCSRSKQNIENNQRGLYKLLNLYNNERFTILLSKSQKRS